MQCWWPQRAYAEEVKGIVDKLKSNGTPLRAFGRGERHARGESRRADRALDREPINLHSHPQSRIGLGNPGKIPELQSGPYLDESDIVRYEDAYGRARDE